MTTATFFDDVKEWSGPYFDAQQLGVRLNFDVDIKSAVQTDEVEVDVTQCENRFFQSHSPCFSSPADPGWEMRSDPVFGC